MNNKLKPAVIGGVFIGLLSAIPLVNWVNVCCCAWAILGGILASYLYVKNSATPANAGDGALVGAIAGGIGAVISLVIGIPLAIVSGGAMREMMLNLMASIDPSQADLLRRQMEMQGESIAGQIVFGVIGAVLLVVFAIIGGLIGIPLFEKRKGGGAMPPPPPPAPGSAPYAA
jgi:hypothetical protein